MPRSKNPKPTRLKAAAFCLGIYVCSFAVVNHYITRDHFQPRTSFAPHRIAFGPHSAEEARVWYSDYCRRQVQSQIFLSSLLRQKLHASPNDAKLHFQYAELLNEEIGPKALAFAQYRQAVKLEPKNTMYHLAFGTMLQQRGHDQEALEQFQAVAKCTPNALNAQYEVGCLLCKNGNFHKGFAMLTQLTRSSDRYWSYAAASHLRTLTETPLHT